MPAGRGRTLRGRWGWEAPPARGYEGGHRAGEILPTLPSLAPGRATRSPPHPLRWLQNGRPAEELAGVRLASRGATLRISHVELGHAGLFACQATNEAGTAGAEVELSVHGEGAGAT